MLGSPKDGNWVAFVCSGPRRDGDVPDQANQLNVTAPVIPFDLKVGGEMHDILARKFVDTIVAVINGKNRSSGKCIGGIFSIRCKT
eukprot:3811638-Prymnesium_polylepis.1